MRQSRDDRRRRRRRQRRLVPRSLSLRTKRRYLYTLASVSRSVSRQLETSTIAPVDCGGSGSRGIGATSGDRSDGRCRMAGDARQMGGAEAASLPPNHRLTYRSMTRARSTPSWELLLLCRCCDGYYRCRVRCRPSARETAATSTRPPDEPV